jgi:hypothetical protein
MIRLTTFAHPRLCTPVTWTGLFRTWRHSKQRFTHDRKFLACGRQTGTNPAGDGRIRGQIKILNGGFRLDVATTPYRSL